MGSWQVKLRNIRQPRLPVWQSKRKKTSSVLFVFSPHLLSLALGFRVPEFLLFPFVFSHHSIFSLSGFEFSCALISPFPFVFSRHPISPSSSIPLEFPYARNFPFPLGVPARPTFPLSPWCSRAPDCPFFSFCSRSPELSPFPLVFSCTRFSFFTLDVPARPISPIPLVFPSAEFNEFNASVLLFIQNISNFLASLPSRILSSKHLPFQHRKVEHDFRKLTYISILYEVNLPQIFRFLSS